MYVYKVIQKECHIFENWDSREEETESWWLPV